jgi:predicted RNA binding protein with dsRBD fold (UPF0201 family)
MKQLIDERFKSWLLDVLKNNEVVITFTKADRTEREMKCTLNPKSIPTSAKEKTQKTVNPDRQVVFDVHKQEWRSFIWSNVKKLEFPLI